MRPGRVLPSLDGPVAVLPSCAAMIANADLLRLAERVMTLVRDDRFELAPSTTSVPVGNYCADARLALERRILFRRYPIAIAAASELVEPGDCLRHDALGLPLLLTRDDAGHAQCFLNVCRHRGMRLVGDEAPCRKKAFVCPYHGWTYGLDGSLRHVPHQDAFDDLHTDARGLVPLPIEDRHGLLWVHPTPGATLDLDAFLGPINDDLRSFDLASHVLHRRADTVRRANWKLVIDAFLEAYHIRVLHRDTIYRFFLDGRAASDMIGPHVRSATARRAATTSAAQPVATWNLREDFTFTHFVFPNSVLIFHPDYVSHVAVFPVDADHVRWVHAMLVPAADATPERATHWEKTFNLIEETVFQREDLFAAEGIQAGLRSGANEAITLGRLEGSVQHFHATIERALDGDPAPR